jgi:hypothetical protein
MNLERIETVHVGLLAVCVVLAAATGWLQVGSLLLGGVLMAANFRLLKALVRRALQPGRGRHLAMLLFAAKFGLFLGLLWMAFQRVPVEGVSFAVGVTLLLTASVVEALRAAPTRLIEGT